MKSMRMMAVAGLLLMAMVAAAPAAEIHGTYLESRDAEIYASHCFANSEMGLRGNVAVMAWRIEEGAFNGVALDGLSVVAIVKANATLGSPFHNPYPAKAALIVDEKATPEQSEALTAMARQMSGDLLATVVRTDVAPITLTFEGGIHARQAHLQAGELLSMRTRAIEGKDSLCHLDDIYYEPLVKLDHAMAAFTLESRYTGEGLNMTFDQRNRSASYVGTFQLGASAHTD
jgi:hypothetical protein